jgi:ABC-type Fe3+-citrate transport system substrate-binding protein
MKKEDLIGLLHKYNHREASEEEGQFLWSYYHLFDTEPDVLDLLNENEKNALKTEIQESIWNRISFYENRKTRANSKQVWW